MNVVYLIILACMALLGGSALVALYWAAKDGQFSNMKGGAEVIFDEDEPIGQPTDNVLKSRRLIRSQRKQASMENIR